MPMDLLHTHQVLFGSWSAVHFILTVHFDEAEFLSGLRVDLTIIYKYISIYIFLF